MLALLSPDSPDGYVEFTLYFEDWRKCEEIKVRVEEKRRRQQEEEKMVISRFLIEECEEEIAKII